jgi:sterol desaturase/sphingolipid hydroxylase (fatty acid hydroxylase superfamily)
MNKDQNHFWVEKLFNVLGAIIMVAVCVGAVACIIFGTIDFCALMWKHTNFK